MWITKSDQHCFNCDISIQQVYVLFLFKNARKVFIQKKKKLVLHKIIVCMTPSKRTSQADFFVRIKSRFTKYLSKKVALPFCSLFFFFLNCLQQKTCRPWIILTGDFKFCTHTRASGLIRLSKLIDSRFLPIFLFCLTRRVWSTRSFRKGEDIKKYFRERHRRPKTVKRGFDFRRCWELENKFATVISCPVQNNRDREGVSSDSTKASFSMFFRLLSEQKRR